MLVRRKGFHSGAIKAVFRANGREGKRDWLAAVFHFSFGSTDTTRDFPFIGNWLSLWLTILYCLCWGLLSKMKLLFSVTFVGLLRLLRDI